MKENFSPQSVGRWLFRLLRSSVVLVTCLLLGKGLSAMIGGLLPGSILGMLLMTALLASGLVKLDWVEPGAGLLLRWLSLLFIPISVALVDQLELLAAHGLSMLLTICLSTLLVLGLAGRMWQWLEGRRE